MIHREHGWPATIVGEQPLMTSTGPTVYVHIHDGAFEDQAECPSQRNRTYSMALEDWDLDTLDSVT